MIGVGIVGASPDGGWAGAAHLPALAHLPEFEIAAVATSRRDSAERAAAAFGAAHAVPPAARHSLRSSAPGGANDAHSHPAVRAFVGWQGLVEHPAVDLVVVSVKAPAHAEVVRGALAAGKHVYVEWPLGANLAETTELAGLAAAGGKVHAIGLQGYVSPSARFVRDLIAEGRVGAVESVSMIATGDPLGGSRIPPGLAWSVDPAAGNTLLTIMVGHSLATVEQLAGGLTEVSATVVNLHPEVTVAGSGERLRSGAPSQVALHGRLAGGAVVSLSLQGGSAPQPDGFTIRVAGTGGALTVTPTVPGHYPGWAEWEIVAYSPDGDRTRLPVPDRYRTVPGVPAGPAANVAALYREIGAAITEGRPAHPGFDTALRHHRELDAIERAASTGTRQLIEEA
jgi:predicted dehydrogenase